MGDNVVQKLDNAIKSINKGADKKEEMRLMMAPNADWDQFISPAPLSIALLGQLILISTETDFTLQDKKESIHFKLLKYPDSFRACLVQVTNSGWGAFNKAHTCMDQIRLHSGNVDKHVRTAAKFLTSGSAQEVELMVPDALKSIENIADNCVRLATSVENEFMKVMDMVAELLEGCTRAKGQHEQDLRDTEIAIQVAKQQKEAVELEKQQAEEKKNLMMKQMKETENEYKGAMDSMPTTGSLIGLAVTDMFIGITRSITDVFTGGMRKGHQDTGGSHQDKGTSNPNSPTVSVDRQALAKLVSQIQSKTMELVELACGSKDSEGKEEPKWNDIQKMEGGAESIKLQLKRIRDSGSQAKKSDMRSALVKLCSDGMEICEQLLRLQKQMNTDDAEIDNVMKRARDLSSNVHGISSALHTILGGNSLPNSPPHLSKQKASVQSQGGGDGGLVNSALQSCRFKTETAKEMLKDSRQMYDKSCDEVAKSAREIGNILAELAKLNLNQIDHETIKKTLIRGIKALALLREQWGKLVQFFQMLSNLVHGCLHTSLKTFVQTSHNQKKLTAAGCSMSDTMRDVIFEQAFQANQIAYVVNSISSVYVEVSQKYLMDRITCLGKLIALDPVKDKREIMLKREELNEGCKEAQDAIVKIALEKKKEMTKALDERIRRIENEVEALMPPISPTEEQEIKDKVKAAVAMGRAMIADEVGDLV